MVKKSTLIVLLTLAVTLTMGIFMYVVIPQCAVHSCDPQGAATTIVNNDPAPYRYRILTRIFAQVLLPVQTQGQYLAIEFIAHAFVFAAVYSGMYIWFKRWTDAVRALLGVFIFVAYLPLGMHIYQPFIGSPLELALLVWSLVLTERYGVIVLIVAVASLNRETALFIPLAYAALHPRDWKRWGALVLIYAVITVGLHLWLGAADHVLGLAGTLAYNLGTISNGLFVNLMLLPLWVGVGLGYRNSPTPLKRLCWVALLYIVSVVVGAAWEEARLQMILFPLVMPVLLRNVQVSGEKYVRVA